MHAAHRAVRTDDVNAHFEFCALPDCSYLSAKGKCDKLDVPKCLGEACPFVRIAGGGAQEEERWRGRLRSLDETKQAAIAKKYYGGSMPWNEEKEQR